VELAPGVTSQLKVTVSAAVVDAPGTCSDLADCDTPGPGEHYPNERNEMK
jgi:hypothetical protein